MYVLFVFYLFVLLHLFCFSFICFALLTPLFQLFQIREKEMEIEIEERECGDDELISMMQAQLEIMKTLLVDELDAEESMQNDKLLDNDMYCFTSSSWIIVLFILF